MSFLEYFDHVRIINVASRDDRRAETRSEFARYGFAIDTDRVKFFEAVTPTEACGFENPGVRGCFLSHLHVLKGAAAEGVSRLLVLEDDIQFSRHIQKLGSVATASLDQMSWDIAYFGHALPNRPGEPGWHRVDGPMKLSHCYAVSGDGLPKLIDFLERILERPAGHPDGGPMHYDGALTTFIKNAPDVEAFYFLPNLGLQRPSKTDLHTPSVWDRHQALKPLATVARRVKAMYFRLVR